MTFCTRGQLLSAIGQQLSCWLLEQDMRYKLTFGMNISETYPNLTLLEQDMLAFGIKI